MAALAVWRQGTRILRTRAVEYKLVSKPAGRQRSDRDRNASN